MTKTAMATHALRWIVSHVIMILVFGIAVWAAFTIGVHWGGEPTADTHTVAPEAPPEAVWTCPMHPEVRMSEPGDCPICGMELVPEELEAPPPPEAEPETTDEPAGYACAMFCVPPLPEPGACPVCGMDMVLVHDEPAAEGDVERQFVMSEEARALADIQTTTVTRQPGTHERRLVGMVEADETRLARVTAYVNGRLDRLYVRYTGAQVERGAPLAGLYSPELLTARAELLQAKQSAARLSDGALSGARAAADSAVKAARERLRLWGLSEAQVRALEQDAADDPVITIPAPISGTVLERHVQQGDYVETGTPVFTVADLSVVWVQLKAYESDLPWIHSDQSVLFTVDALPGETFEGHVAFIDPVLSSRARTANVRVEVSNEAGLLKPGMFARAVVKASVTDPDGTPPLLIPASAPLITGTRAVVYVVVPDQDRPTFEGREILLGPRAGDYYVVREGLVDGEEVVSRGAFRIDSALQIRTRPSMMQAAPPEHAHTPDEDAPSCCETAPEHAHTPDEDAPSCCEIAPEHALPPALDEATHTALSALFNGYIETQQALAADDSDASADGFAAILSQVTATQEAVPAEASEAMERPLKRLQDAARAAAATDDIETMRRHFQPISDVLIDLAQQLPNIPDSPMVQVHCPMAFDDTGADWLQQGDEVRNPYFGASMLACGVIQERYGPDPTNQ